MNNMKMSSNITIKRDPPPPPPPPPAPLPPPRPPPPKKKSSTKETTIITEKRKRKQQQKLKERNSDSKNMEKKTPTPRHPNKIPTQTIKKLNLFRIHSQRHSKFLLQLDPIRLTTIKHNYGPMH